LQAQLNTAKNIEMMNKFAHIMEKGNFSEIGFFLVDKCSSRALKYA
jgi:hypothetical protein